MLSVYKANKGVVVVVVVVVVVLVLSDVRPSNGLTFCNVSARQGFSIC